MAINKRYYRDEVSPVAIRATECMNLSIEADSGNREKMLHDLKFSHGDQWPDEVKMQRQLDKRPCLTINKTDAFIRAVVNNMRQQRPRIKVHPVGDGADQKKAELYEGIIRHIEVNSNADVAYDVAADNQVRIGIGYFRIIPQYIDERSFDQELFIHQVKNPFSVYFDPSSQQPDGLDANWCVITDRIRKSEFKLRWPNASDQDFSPSGEGDNQAAWSTKEETMIAEFLRFEEKADVLFKLANGQTLFKSDAPEGKKVGDFLGDSIIIDARSSIKRVLKWSMVTKTQELECRELPWKYLGVIPIYGAEMLQDGKIFRFGMVRHLVDPQCMYNFWRTQETEFVALAPKAPWLIAEGQIENHEDEWATANIKNHNTLTYKAVTDDNGNVLPPPQRMQPQAVPAASVNAAMAASEDLKAVAGMFDPALGAPGQETSGDMVARRQQQSELSNYHFYDNLTRSLRAAGVVLLDLIKIYYSGERVIRIIGADGNPDMITINQQTVDEILNDVSVGRYDVVMETGPGYNTKREEAAEKMLQMLSVMPELGQIAGDLIVGQMDWPGAEQLTERLKMANPLAQMQGSVPEDIDPKARPIVAQLLGKVNNLQKQVEALSQEKMAKLFGVKERETLVTDREMMKEAAATQRNREDNQTWMHDTELRMKTDMAQTLIDAETNLKIHHQKAIEGSREPN
jgi:hypothetical protein